MLLGRLSSGLVNVLASPLARLPKGEREGKRINECMREIVLARVREESERRRERERERGRAE